MVRVHGVLTRKELQKKMYFEGEEYFTGALYSAMELRHPFIRKLFVKKVGPGK